MKSFSTSEKDIRLIGEGGNSQTYLSEGAVNGVQSAVIKVPKAFVDRRVDDILMRHEMLQKNGIKTTAFLEECMLDGNRAILTENLHSKDYTYLDCNAHLLREEDKLLQLMETEFHAKSEVIEPEEEKWFADNRFYAITNLIEFANTHIAFLSEVSEAGIYLAYDSYFFKVNRQASTDIDYIIADWDDVMACKEENLYELNKEQFKTALWQFVDRFVVVDVGEKYKEEIMSMR